METSGITARSWAVLCIIAASLVATWPIVHAGFYKGDDWLFELVRLADYHDALSRGGFPVRWSANLEGGYGLPIYNYFPPLFLLLGSALIGLGLSTVGAAKAAVLILTIIAGFGMYSFSSRFWGRTGGALSALLYVLAPYRFTDAFLRSALSELTALSVAPWVFWAMAAVLERERPTYRTRAALAVSAALFALSHNLSAIMFLPLALAFAFAYRPRRIMRLAVPSALAVMLSAFYTFPAAFETSYIQSWQLTAGKFSIWNNFASPWELLMPGVFFGPSLFWVAVLPITAAVLIQRASALDPLARRTAWMFLALGTVSLWLATDLSAFVWRQVPGAALFQFPWRWLSAATFAVCAAGGIVAAVPGAEGRKLGLALLALGLMAFAFKSATQQHSYVTFKHDVESIRQGDLSGTAVDEYLPATVFVEPSPKPSPGVLTAPLLAEEDARIEYSGTGRGVARHEFLVALREGATLRANILYFPGWAVYVDGLKVPFTLTPEGTMRFEVGEGTHQVVLALRNTPLRSVSNLISICGLLILAATTGWGAIALWLMRRRSPKEVP